jgi:outer membrane protein insertion porin family
MPLHSRSEHTLQHSNILVFLFVSLLAISCAAVKKPPHNVPYAYKNNISLKAPKLNGEERSLLVEKLYTYLDDSLIVPERSILGFTQRIKPPLFDSGSVTRSITFMNGYLNAVGYYGASFDTFTVRMDTLFEGKKTEIRTTTHFFITLGKNLRVDTLAYAFNDTVLQRLANGARKDALLKHNSAYSKDAMAGELERLATLFRNNGFFRMSRSALLAEADTTDPSLISMDNDPIEQLLEAQKRKEDPRIILKVMQRPGVDTTVFRQYYIDSVVIYPETKITDEAEQLMKDTTFNELIGRRSVTIRQKLGTFRPRLIRRNNYIIPGNLYKDSSYFRTINNYWRMGPWQQVDVKTFVHYDSLSKVDFNIFLYPAKKQNFQLDLEGSQNNNISVSNSLSGRFFALSLNATHRSRNVFRSGIQSITAARVGFEINLLNDDNAQFFQTFILTANQTFSIPKLTWPFGFVDQRKLEAARTQVSFSAIYTDRFDFYKQIGFTAGLQWEIRKGKNTYSFAFPNFESFYIRETDSLVKEIQENPSLQYAFTPGNILSFKAAWEHKLSFPRRPRNAGYFRVATELSPFKFSLFNRQAFQFYRLEAQIVKSKQLVRSSINYRAYAGCGWNFNTDEATGQRGTLPYYRQYVAGGSNSMRAWGLRQLGIGRSIVSDTAGFTDRFGDIQFEVNAEYRFKLFRLFGFGFGGALFGDIGNIWNHTNNPDGEGKFEFSRLYEDLAFDIGTGIRWDVSYLVIRLDAAYKIKDPVREGAGWLKTLEWKTSNRLGSPSRSNIGLQFGIGYPF